MIRLIIQPAGMAMPDARFAFLKWTSKLSGQSMSELAGVERLDWAEWVPVRNLGLGRPNPVRGDGLMKDKEKKPELNPLSV